MFQHANPKCANPACQTAFDWTKDGKYFRFGREQVCESRGQQNEPEHNLHDVEHFWLCNRCSQMFTLVYAKGQGVVLRPALPPNASANSQELKVA